MDKLISRFLFSVVSRCLTWAESAERDYKDNIHKRDIYNLSIELKERIIAFCLAKGFIII
jgi:hypothetical protein